MQDSEGLGDKKRGGQGSLCKSRQMTSDFRLYDNAVPLQGFHCHRFETVASTQDLLKQWVAHGLAGPGTVVKAEEQTHGRGRMGHAWTSLRGKGLWLSVYFQPCLPLDRASAWNMNLALAVCKALDAVAPWGGWQMKWPNDWVSSQGRKAGGMLVENQLRGSLISDSWVGIGINVDPDAVDARLPFATSLMAEGHGKPQAGGATAVTLQEKLFEALLTELEWLLEPYNPLKGPWNIPQIIEEVDRRLYGLGQNLPFLCKERTEYWVPLGLSPDGGLRVRSENGDLVQTLYHPHHRMTYTLDL
jgi:biotin-[acetyl-CoA-carboxylase] ligase BirA-like protein